jgi:hypothetical protein
MPTTAFGGKYKKGEGKREKCTGVYIREKMKKGRENEENVKEKGRKGKEKDKMGFPDTDQLKSVMVWFRLLILSPLICHQIEITEFYFSKK